MAIKIVVYNDSYTKVEEEIRNFPSASAAADYRDHDDWLIYKATKLEQDESKPVYYGPILAMDADGTERDGSRETQVIQYHPDWMTTLANLFFYVKVVVLSLAAIGSFYILIFSIAGG